jgi:hypothetical protein
MEIIAYSRGLSTVRRVRDGQVFDAAVLGERPLFAPLPKKEPSLLQEIRL